MIPTPFIQLQKSSNTKQVRTLQTLAVAALQLDGHGKLLHCPRFSSELLRRAAASAQWLLAATCMHCAVTED